MQSILQLNKGLKHTLSKRHHLHFHQIPIYLKEQEDTSTNFGKHTFIFGFCDRL